MSATIAEKILARKAGKLQVVPGEIVTVEPDLAMSHDNAGLVIKQFRQIGVDEVWNPGKIVIPLDHRVPAESEKTAAAHKSIRQFVKEQGIEHFYDIKEGICHQVVVEHAHILPGELAVGTDSHTTSYGCIGALSTGIGATEMAAVWAIGKIWLRIPDTLKITVKGRFAENVYAKDLILHIAGTLTAEGANYRSIEYYGETVERMSISERFTIANLSMEMGAKFAVVPYDEVTEEFMKGLGKGGYEAVFADSDAAYFREYDFEVSDLKPKLAVPHHVDNIADVAEYAGMKIDQVVLGSCTNGRLDDLEIAARYLEGRKVASNVRMLVIPASRSIYLQALEEGLIKTFLEAEAVVLNSGCGPCLGAHQGVLAAGEKCLATTNRNFKGRMGSTEAEVYLASPATAAASAVAGEVVVP